MRVRFSPAAFMPRTRKTSTQPKRKPQKPVKIVKPVYPQFIEDFIKEVESKTSLKVKVDRYMKENSYNVGVNMKVGKVSRCIWMVGVATGSEHLQPFWVSAAMKSWNDKSV